MKSVTFYKTKIDSSPIHSTILYKMMGILQAADQSKVFCLAEDYTDNKCDILCIGQQQE